MIKFFETAWNDLKWNGLGYLKTFGWLLLCFSLFAVAYFAFIILCIVLAHFGNPLLFGIPAGTKPTPENINNWMISLLGILVGVTLVVKYVRHIRSRMRLQGTLKTFFSAHSKRSTPPTEGDKNV